MTEPVTQWRVSLGDLEGLRASGYESRQIGFKECLGAFLGLTLVSNGFLNGHLGPFRPDNGRKGPR